jgi:chaperonin GroES
MSKAKPVLKAIGGRILVKMDEPEKKSSGGILLPDNARQIVRKGTVINLGCGERMFSVVRSDFPVKEGDKVWTAPGSGYMVEHEGEAFWLLMESDILAIVE